MLAQQMKKQNRHEQILLSLDNLVYATQRQLQITNDLGGDRNAHRILQDMEKERTIGSIRTEKKIYFLSKQGKEQIGSSQGELNKSMLTHTLMRNDMYIALGMPANWKKEAHIKWEENKLIPDARYIKNGEYHFVEIDNKQQMRTNLDKIKKYKELSHVIFKQYNHTPTLIWYTLSNIRKEKLKKACTRAGVKFKLY